jgi:hypothetical protein
VTIQIARRIGNALGVSSATKVKELDTALREYVRSVSPAATTPVSGTIDASQVVSGTFGNARVAASNVTQHQAALAIAWAQLTGIPATFTPADHLVQGTWTPTDNSGAGLAFTITDARYVKHEKFCIVHARMSWPATADTNQASLAGLPFALDANESSRQGFVSYSNAAVALYVVPNGSASTCAFFTTGGGTVSNATMSGTVVFFTLMYRTP